MIRIILLLVCLGIFYPASSQEVKPSRKTRKEIRRNEELQKYHTLGAILGSRRFLLEIESIQYQSRTMKKSNPMENIIMIDSLSCTWHSESNDIPTDLFSTVSKAQGSIDDWILKNNLKHLDYFLKFKMFTDNGLFRVSVTLYPDRTFSGNISGSRDDFIIYGRIFKQ